MRYIFGFFIVFNLVIEVINVMYMLKIVINKDKYKCMVREPEKSPQFYKKLAEIQKEQNVVNVTGMYESIFS